MDVIRTSAPPRGLYCHLITLLRCGSCRFAAYYFLSFQIALLAGDRSSIWWGVFGFAFWLLHCLGIELLNRYSDRVEDHVNRPERTKLCEAIGYHMVKTYACVIWIFLATFYVVWFVFDQNVVLLSLLCAGLFVGTGYSIGIRFKSRRYLALIVLTFPFGGPFLIGWAASHPNLRWPQVFFELFQQLGPFLLVVGLYIIGHAGIKDITDANGDRKIRYRAMWIDFVEHRAFGLAYVSVSLWYILCITFICFRGLPIRFGWLLVFAPISILFANATLKATNGIERSAVREMFYHYWLGFESLALYLLLPTPQAFLTIVIALGYWIITSQYLHWTTGIRLDKIRVICHLAFSHRGSRETLAQPTGDSA